MSLFWHLCSAFNLLLALLFCCLICLFLQVGTFSVASEEVLKNRAIKKAKRRNVGFEVSASCSFGDLLTGFPVTEHLYSKCSPCAHFLYVYAWGVVLVCLLWHTEGSGQLWESVLSSIWSLEIKFRLSGLVTRQVPLPAEPFHQHTHFVCMYVCICIFNLCGCVCVYAPWVQVPKEVGRKF